MFPAIFQGPANALVPTELPNEKRLFVSDVTKKLSVLDIYTQHVNRHCSSLTGKEYTVCSQAAGQPKRQA